MTHMLTSDQQEAADAFFSFLMNDAQTFVISGKAGVGKTFLMGYLCDKVMVRYEGACAMLGIEPEYLTATFTATTNKAAEVLERSINRPVSTIHSLLGLKVNENHKTGKTSCEPNPRTGLNKVKNQILFIDESSMIDPVLYGYILKACKNTKVVFVGDHAQMAPVNEVISPVYQNVEEDNFVFLSTMVRNADSPPLMALCDQLRDTVESGIFQPIQEVPGTIEFLSKDRMQSKVDEVFKDPTDSARILCYTNKRVQMFNEYVRELRKQSDMFEEGDELVVAEAYFDGKTQFSVERQVYVYWADHGLYNAGFGNVLKDGREVQYYMLGISRTKPEDYDEFFDGKPVEVMVPADPDHYQAVLKQLRKQKDWSAFFHLKNMFIDLRGKESCTVYKSQGSTYDTVFMDLGNIGTSWDAEQVARMLFVGASRARSKLYFFGRLPGKYQGAKAA